MEGDCVFEAADAVSASLSFCTSGGSGVHELEADVGQVERLAGVREINCCIHIVVCVCCEMDKER